MEERNCIVFGGGGFIGQNLVNRLIQEGYNVTIYDRKLSEKNITDKATRIEGDFFEEKDLKHILYNQDVVIHLISGVSPSTSMMDIYSPYQRDIIKTLELLESCRSQGIKRLIFLSSGGTVYGNQSKKPIKEDAETNPINHYGVMKLTIEKILLLYNQIYDMENVILRVANPYGKGQDPQKRIGAVSVFLNSVLNDVPITLYGTGGVTRDYIEITDVCEAVLLSLIYKLNYNTSPVFNVGTGTGFTLSGIIDQIEKISNKKAEIIYRAARSMDVEYNVLDITKSKKELNFHPKYDLHAGIKRLLQERAMYTSGIQLDM